MHTVIILKDALQEGHMRFNAASTYPSSFILNHHLTGQQLQGGLRHPYILSFYKRCMGSVSKVNLSPFSANIPFSGATSSKETQDILYARQKIIVVAKAFGLQAIDLVYIDFRDEEGLLRQAREGATMGFTGMVLDGILNSSV